jgi:hypothetical protein
MSTPYDNYRQSKEWKIISDSIQALVRNQDIKMMTNADYVIGYITKEIIDKSPKIKE